MPRKYRITEVGFYHIISRGVERRLVFLDEDDFDMFLEVLKFVSKSYGITIHSYCLMSNHYHLLIETTQTNISKIGVRYLIKIFLIFF